MQFIRRIPRWADGAARYLVVGALFVASVVVWSRAPGGDSLAPKVDAAVAHVGDSTTLATATPASKLAIATAYGNLPLRFEANRGQADPRVRFLARGSGSELFLADTEAVLVLTKPISSNSERAANVPAVPSLTRGIAQPPVAVQSTALRFSLVGSNSGAQVTGI